MKLIDYNGYKNNTKPSKHLVNNTTSQICEVNMKQNNFIIKSRRIKETVEIFALIPVSRPYA